MEWLDLKTFALLSSLLFGAGGAAGLFLGSLNKSWATRLALTCALAGSLLSAYGAVGFWQEPMQRWEPGISLVPALPGGFPSLNVDLFVDRLAAFFLLLTGLLSAGAALYSFIWLEDKQERDRIAGIYNLFVLFTLLLLVVNNVYLFLLFLELITLAFGYLTLYRLNTLLEKLGKHEDVAQEEMIDAKRASKVYLISSHIGIIFITTSLLLLALAAQNLGFDVLRSLDLSSKPILASAIFVLALAGFGVKTAITPSQSWMALVHPYLPTNIHALVSSIVIKVAGIYGLIRVVFEFLPNPPLWWGGLVLVLAGLTALVGVFYAITSRDLKTALANHSVENIGIILAGLGLELLHFSPLAGLGLVASLYHLLNHAIFKSLLFLGAGAIENRTGTVQLEELGGLMRRFRWTSITFLVGTVAIAGFPPLNGFISEWLLLQALFASLATGFLAPAWAVASLFGALLMLGAAFGLTALAFVKIAGEVLLGVPRRSEILAQAKPGDVPWPMRGVLVVLAVLCLLLGLFPGLVVNRLILIAQEVLGTKQLVPITTATTSLTLSVKTPASAALYTAHLSLLPVIFLVALPLVLAIAVGLRWKRPARGKIWTCGTRFEPATMQITGGAFAFLIWERAGGRRAKKPGDTTLRSQPGSTADILVEEDGDTVPWRLPLSATRYVREYFRQIINNAVNSLVSISQKFGEAFQAGDIRLYLFYLFVAFVFVLIVSILR